MPMIITPSNPREEPEENDTVRWFVFSGAAALLCGIVIYFAWTAWNYNETRFSLASNERLSALGECEKAVLAEKARYGNPINNNMVWQAEDDCAEEMQALKNRNRRDAIARQQLAALEEKR
jgi:hypothetical protein